MLPQTVARLIKNRVSENGSSLLLQRKDGWSWKQITWKDFETDVKSVAAFVADAGFETGDRAFFESCGTYQGLVSETAIFMLGGIAVSQFPFSEQSPVPPSKIVFARNRDGALRIARRCGAEKVIFYSGLPGAKPDSTTAHFDAAVKFGFLKRKKMTDALEEIFSSVSPDSAAVEALNGNGSPQTFSQKGFMDMLGDAMKQTAGSLNSGSQIFSHLPRADMFSRAAKFLSLCACARSAAAQNGADFLEDILEVMPTVVFLDSDRLEEIPLHFGAVSGSRADGAVFGGRLTDIFTDRVPDGRTAEFYSEMGIRVSGIFVPGNQIV